MVVDSNNLVVLGLDDQSHLLGEKKQEWQWGPLKVYCLYRLFLTSLLLILFNFTSARAPLGTLDEQLFHYVLILHLLVCCLGIITVIRRQPNYFYQVAFAVTSDILALSLMIYASGGLTSGLGLLILVAVASGSILLNELAFPFAAMATIALLVLIILLQLHPDQQGAQYTQAGLMGIALFVCAFLVRSLSNRLRVSETLARQRGEFITEMQQLNSHIVQRFNSGIVVTQPDGQIKLMNEIAWHLLGYPRRFEASNLEQLSHGLYKAYSAWRRHPELPSEDVTISPGGMTLTPRFSPLGDPKTEPVLILLEDSSRLKQQAQKMKLASLGGLTAGIAHEIRNPLGAISHAAQLLLEQETTDNRQSKLIDIIVRHTQRVNQIIENVMNLSNRDHVKTESIDLHDFLQTVVNELKQRNREESLHIELKIEPRDTQVQFDPVQLHQVLTNLCNNAVHHSKSNEPEGDVQLKLLGGTSAEFNTPILDIIDNGPGIEPEIEEHIFEPFYTTSHQGMGLGLYMAQQLCEANQAQLEYLALPQGGSCFRIRFKAVTISRGQT
ncbi:MAG TPA: hypothetical protein DCZ03_06500 [Gammaproteobacteria bacterium]|nr:hypothetical protein [Gammaproteobacteria bacterium]